MKDLHPSCGWICPTYSTAQLSLILTVLYIPSSSSSCGPSLQVNHITDDIVILLSFILKVHVGSMFVRKLSYRPVWLHFPEGRNFSTFSIGLTFMGPCIVRLFQYTYPTRCNVTQFIISRNCSTCFGWYPHPSSGARTTVSTATGTCHTAIVKELELV